MRNRLPTAALPCCSGRSPGLRRSTSNRLPMPDAAQWLVGAGALTGYDIARLPLRGQRWNRCSRRDRNPPTSRFTYGWRHPRAPESEVQSMRIAQGCQGRGGCCAVCRWGDICHCYSKWITRQPRRRAWAVSTGSALTATGWSTWLSRGRSLCESL